MSHHRQPQFLGPSDHPTNRVRCPIHGFIHYSDNERKLLNHRMFQRLRFIRQLALTELVYPGATHTRFEHSLGVMEMATHAFDRLAQKYGAVLESEFKTVGGLESTPMAIARQTLRLAALLHDVGHAAFSHAAEESVHKDLGHEALSIRIIKDADYLGALIDGMFGTGFADRVALVVQGPPHIPPQLQVLSDLVSGEMDADRSDYLVRDSHHCGVDYGRFDYRRLIESIEIDSGSGKVELALNRDGLHAFEALILSRYQMSTQVYYHRLRRIYDTYLVRYHEALGPSAFDSADKIIAENDTTMLARIMASADGDGPESSWARRIVTRQHHRLVFEPGIHIVGGHDLGCARKVFQDVQAKYPDSDLVLDIPKKPIKIHKLLMPADDAENSGTDLMLVSASAGNKPVARSSQIFSTIPKAFRPIRIFADIEDRARRSEVQQYAASRWTHHGGTS